MGTQHSSSSRPICLPGRLPLDAASLCRLELLKLHVYDKCLGTDELSPDQVSIGSRVSATTVLKDQAAERPESLPKMIWCYRAYVCDVYACSGHLPPCTFDQGACPTSHRTYCVSLCGPVSSAVCASATFISIQLGLMRLCWRGAYSRQQVVWPAGV